MADDRKTPDRPVQRCFEGQRLEEQLWSLAYQELWPVIRKKTTANGAKRQQRDGQNSCATPNQARRA
jgi:hypothetical protein